MPWVSTAVTTQVAALVNTSVVSMGAMVAALTAAQINPDSSLWSITEFRLACIVGAIGGGVLYIGIWPDVELSKATGHRYGQMLASRYSVCCIFGMMFTPAIFMYLEIPKTIDSVLVVSGMMAFVSVAMLTFIAEQFTEILRVWLIAAKQWFLGKFFPIKNSENQDRRPASIPLKDPNDSV